MTGFAQEADIEGKLHHVSRGVKRRNFGMATVRPLRPSKRKLEGHADQPEHDLFGKNGYTLFRIMLQETALISNPSRPTRAHEGW
jgi:hypothetical protein